MPVLLRAEVGCVHGSVTSSPQRVPRPRRRSGRAPSLPKGDETTLTPETHGHGFAHVARADFLPLVFLPFLLENVATRSDPEPGGRRPRWVVARWRTARRRLRPVSAASCRVASCELLGRIARRGSDTANIAVRVARRRRLDFHPPRICVVVLRTYPANPSVPGHQPDELQDLVGCNA